MRLIDAVALADEVFTITIHATGMRNGKTLLQECLEKYRNEVLRTICKAPTVDAKEVVHGRWVDTDYKPDIYCKCSVCGRRTYVYDDYNYCPNCGADMRDGDGNA